VLHTARGAADSNWAMWSPFPPPVPDPLLDPGRGPLAGRGRAAYPSLDCAERQGEAQAAVVRAEGLWVEISAAATKVKIGPRQKNGEIVALALQHSRPLPV
jgi:hypothetical protein